MKAKEKISSYITSQLQLGRVLRLGDVVNHFQNEKIGAKLIRSVLENHEAYQAVIPQQRPPNASRKRRMISTPALGYYHGDIGFMSINDRYPTPPKYRSGFIVLIDVLSRFVMIEILPTNRKANTMIKVLKKLCERHREIHHYPYGEFRLIKKGPSCQSLCNNFLKTVISVLHLLCIPLVRLN